MEWIAAMQQAINYMEAHIMEKMNYEDVAKHVHTSSYETICNDLRIVNPWIYLYTKDCQSQW